MRPAAETSDCSDWLLRCFNLARNIISSSGRFPGSCCCARNVLKQQNSYDYWYKWKPALVERDLIDLHVMEVVQFTNQSIIKNPSNIPGSRYYILATAWLKMWPKTRSHTLVFHWTTFSFDCTVHLLWYCFVKSLQCCKIYFHPLLH